MFKKTIVITMATALALISASYAYSKIENKIQINKIETQKEEVKKSSQNTLDVQFICQAPLQTEENWELHEESCEEAALLQAYIYSKNQSITKEEANKEVLKMIDWQNKNLGGHFDLYTEKMKKFAKGYYNLDDDEFITVKQASIEDIRNVIDQGYPVIAPVVSEHLNNPFYPHPGYHMLVVKGYTKTHLITNDNGTRRGEDFNYTYEVFQKALTEASGDIYYLKLK